MLNFLLLTVILLDSFFLTRSAYAHFGLSGDEDVGHALFWFYGILLTSIIGYVIYRKWLAKNETPERLILKRRLSEFERTLNSCLVQLQNADDYPNECGLTDMQRLERNKTISTIQKKIDEIRLELAMS